MLRIDSETFLRRISLNGNNQCFKNMYIRSRMKAPFQDLENSLQKHCKSALLQKTLYNFHEISAWHRILQYSHVQFSLNLSEKIIQLHRKVRKNMGLYYKIAQSTLLRNLYIHKLKIFKNNWKEFLLSKRFYAPNLKLMEMILQILNLFTDYLFNHQFHGSKMKK